MNLYVSKFFRDSIAVIQTIDQPVKEINIKIAMLSTPTAWIPQQMTRFSLDFYIEKSCCGKIQTKSQ